MHHQASHVSHLLRLLSGLDHGAAQRQILFVVGNHPGLVALRPAGIPPIVVGVCVLRVELDGLCVIRNLLITVIIQRHAPVEIVFGGEILLRRRWLADRLFDFLLDDIGGMLLSIIGMGFAVAGYMPPVSGAIVQEVIDGLAILNALQMTWTRNIAIDMA